MLKEIKEEEQKTINNFYDEFKNELAKVFNDDPEMWSCEFCKWVDCDPKICAVCNVLIEEAITKTGEVNHAKSY